jgi:signal transduction histidine kinase
LIGAVLVDYGEQDHTDVAPDEVQLAETMARLGAQVVERDRLSFRVTEARANELAMRATQAQMDTFVGIASHELRAPLTRLQLSLDSTEHLLHKVSTHEAVAERDSGQQAVALFQEHLVRSQQQLDQLQRLIDDLVDASRVHAGKLQVRLGPCDLLEVVEHAVDAEREVVADRTISLQLPVDVHIAITGDAGRLEQVVLNFLTNALKYSPADRPVTVGVQTDDQQARVWVRDEGPGLPEAELDRIWERFHRAPGIEVLSGMGVGLGLGLYICRTIVEQHHGHVGVDSTPSVGSTFWFTLPLAADDQ